MRQKRLTVLVVDDHFLVREGLKCTINAQRDMQVVAEAESGPQAIELFRKHRPVVTLMDLRMREMTGVDAIAAIREIDPQARILVLTSAEGSEDVYRALRAGSQGYLVKDGKSSQLLQAIRDVSAGKRVVPPEVAARLAERLPQSDLSPREMDVLRLIIEGLSNKEIAGRLGLSTGTVRTHVSNILGKLGVSDRTQAATAALQRGIIPSP